MDSNYHSKDEKSLQGVTPRLPQSSSRYWWTNHIILLMEEILHHPSCMKPCELKDIWYLHIFTYIYQINWRRISSINSIFWIHIGTRNCWHIGTSIKAAELANFPRDMLPPQKRLTGNQEMPNFFAQLFQQAFPTFPPAHWPRGRWRISWNWQNLYIVSRIPTLSRCKFSEYSKLLYVLLWSWSSKCDTSVNIIIEYILK